MREERVWHGVGIATKVRAPSINIDDVVDDDATEARLLRLSVTKADKAAQSTPDVPDGADVTRVVFEGLRIDLFHDGYVLHITIRLALALE